MLIIGVSRADPGRALAFTFRQESIEIACGLGSELGVVLLRYHEEHGYALDLFATHQLVLT